MTGLLFCHECSEGKHVNCDGAAWSNELDGPAPCTCPDPIHAHIPDHNHEKCCRYLRCAHPACCGYYGGERS